MFFVQKNGFIMFCLKCKKEISDDLLRCNYCNTKVQSVCPVCGRINVITSEFCNGCGLQLLKYCQECKTVNLPVAKKCRKCGIDFEIDEDAITISDINQDCEKITKVSSVEISVKKQDISDVESGPLPIMQPINTSEIEISKEESLERKSISSFSDLLALTEIDSSIDESMSNENITEEHIVNVDDVKVQVDDNDLVKEDEVLKSADDELENVLQSDESSTEQNLESEKESLVEEESINENVEEEIEQFVEIVEYDQMKCKNLLMKSILDPQKKIIGFSAQEGCGKSTVLKYLFEDLKKQPRAWFWGECSANSQISPYGIFQEMILTFFNMPNFSNMSQEFLAQARQMLTATLPFFSYDEITNLINFLYPHLIARFEDILVNKDVTFALLEKLLIGLSQKVKLIIVVDDFDMIDGASFEFLSYFVDKGLLSENIKLLITYKDKRITHKIC